MASGTAHERDDRTPRAFPYARSPLTRRRFLSLLTLGAGTLFLPTTLMAGASGRLVSERASQDACAETRQQILDIAATVEALAVTFYYRATQSDLFARLSSDNRRYVRAALDQERAHLAYLSGLGAHPLANVFFFPTGIFGFDSLAQFLAVVDTIETTTVGLYIAAMRRFGEIGQAAMAEVAGQLLGVEAEQRVIGREIAQNGPPPPNDRCFELATDVCVDWTLARIAPLLSGGVGSDGPFSLPDSAAISAALGGVSCADVPPASARVCQESISNLLNTAATAEALGITFYYQAIKGGIFTQLTQPQQWYLQAALDEERTHLAFLAAHGAAPAASLFYFPADAFVNVTTFLSVLDTLENLFISAYLAAAQRFVQLGQPLLAAIAGQILGVEAEHRVLGRLIGGQMLPSDLRLERASSACAIDMAAALQPFVQGGSGYTRQAVQPDDPQIRVAVDRFGCAPIATATSPAFARVPFIAK